MKRVLAIALAMLLCMAAADGPYRTYIETYSPTAISEMQRSGVPASITLAQGLVESAAGQSTLAVKANNHFGIKCHSDWKGKKIYKDDDKANECFRVYPNAEASFRDHSDFLRFQDRYKSLFDLEPTDYRSWAKGLKKAGYATDPKYADKLIKVIEDYQLYRFDVAESVPDAPLEIEKPVELTVHKVSELYRFQLSRDIYEVNGVPCVYAVAGDTFQSLADSYGLFKGELLRFNDLRNEIELNPGDVVYLKSKKGRGARGLEKYIASGNGETLRDISQRFGIKLSALRRFNKLAADSVPLEGDTIVLRRR